MKLGASGCVRFCGGDADEGARLKRKRSALRKKGCLTDVADKWLAVTKASEGRRPGAAGASARSGEYLGDIAISPATARRNAKKNGRTFSR